MFANSIGEHKNVCCGLVRLVEDCDDFETQEKPIPLVSVDVNATVVHSVAQVEVTQVYVNKEKQPIEAIYYFPINPEGAVTHFRAELEGKTIKGVVKPKEEAKKTYDKAVKNKTTAFLGEETDADIFKVCVGFLKPGTQVKVIIGYVTEVKNEPGSNALRFYIPTTIAPRYVSPSDTDDKAKDIEKMNTTSAPAPLSLKVTICLQGKIKYIKSPTHNVKVENLGQSQENSTWEKAIVQLAGQTTDMDRDFLLAIMPEDIQRARLYSEKLENGSTAVMIHSLVPSFKLKDQKTELLFVLDRSGSMMGPSIGQAKKALLKFLHSMPADCYFNVIGFGSTFKFLFPQSVKYDDGSLKKAVAHANSLNADLGGTEIMGPLQAIYQKPAIKGYLRQIFILTDGEVCNTDGVIGIAQANAHKARVFALGIGAAASHHLVEGIARAGGGTSAFVTYKESIDKKVLNQLKNGLQPSLTDIELEWEGIKSVPKPDEPLVLNKSKTLVGYNKPLDAATKCVIDANLQSPKRVPPIYDGSQLLVFGLFKGEVPSAVKVTAQSPDGPLSVKIEQSPEDYVGKTGMLHRLAAVKLIRELELDVAALQFQRGNKNDEAKLKKEIIQLGCDNGISSKYTSFVAVDVDDDKPSADNWVMESRHVPSQVAQRWRGGYGASMSTGGSSVRKCAGARRSCTKARAVRSTYVARKSTGGVEMRRRKASVSAPKRSTPAKRAKLSSANSKSTSSTKRRSSIKPKSSTKPRSSIKPRSSTKPNAQNATPLDKMIALQSYDGSYKLNADICAILKRQLKDLKQVAKNNNLKENVLATALAISFFAAKLADDKDVWDLVVTKARKWMSKTVTAEKVDGIITIAKKFL